MGDRLRLELVSVNGPGEVALFSNDPLGNPVVHWNTGDGLGAADAVQVPAGGHAHYSWAFAAPGTYRLGLRVSGTLQAGNAAVTSEVAHYTFTVPAPVRRLDAS